MAFSSSSRVEAPPFKLPSGVVHGLTVVHTSGFELVDEQGPLLLSNDDPQIILRLSSNFLNVLACEVIFEAKILRRNSSRPQFYLDYLDQGFCEDCSFALSQQADQTYRAIIALPGLEPVLRWDPSDRAGQLDLKGIRVEQWADPLMPSIGGKMLPSFTNLTTEERSAWADRAFTTSCALNQRYLKAVVKQGVAFKPSNENQPQALQLPAKTLDGVTITHALGVEVTDTPGLLRLFDSDPQLIMRLEPNFRDVLACQVIFEAQLLEGASPRPRIYLDYFGQGFRQDCSFALNLQADHTYRAIIAFPGLEPVIRWDPSERPGLLDLKAIKVAHWSDPLSQNATISLPVAAANLNQNEREAWADHAFETARNLNKLYLNAGVEQLYDYSHWVKFIEPASIAAISGDSFIGNKDVNVPLFSFVVPTYNTPVHLLEECIAALQAQSYQKFEICIADDNSSDDAVRRALSRLAADDSRIKLCFRSENGHISQASNSALELASGDFIVLVDHDDIIPPYTLEIVSRYISANPTGKIFYSDEDKLNSDGERCDPYFKSDFNRFLMFGHNMVSHLGVYERELLKSIGGFRKGYEGSQDYDLFLRCLGKCSDRDVIHIPHVLYHWRMIHGSTSVSADQKSYAIIAAQKSLNDFLQREGIPFRSVDGITAGITALEVTDAVPEAKISIIIPTRDRLDLLVPCMNSLNYDIGERVEIIIVDNGSTESETRGYFDALRRNPFIKVVSAPGEFNFSAICNTGVAASTGEIICLLNNDTELVARNWLKRARAFLSVSDVGIVGARLLYPDQTVQHFGLYLGMGANGVAGTPHRGAPSSDFGPFGKARLVQEFSAVTAACMFVKRSVYEQVGGFDPELRVAYNDVDFCLKVRALGLKVICDPDILLIHKESKSRGMDDDGSKAKRLEDEAALMRMRWGELLRADPYYNPNLTLERDDFSLAGKPRTPNWRNIAVNHQTEVLAVEAIT